MKRLILPALLFAAATATFAQTPAPQQPTTPPARHHHDHDPQKTAAKMSKALNLTSDQSAKLEPILAARQQKIAALEADTTLTPKDRKKQAKAIHADTEQQLSGVLTPDQLTQMKSMHHGGKGHGRKEAEPLNQAPTV